MKTTSRIEQKRIASVENAGFTFETTFVLFFLAIEFGRSFSGFTLDGVFVALTLLMVAVLPYFLPSSDKPSFGIWLSGRTAITLFAVLLGVLFKQSVGVFLPETFRFLPMTLLIVAAMLSCYIQFYGFLKLRFVK